MCIHDFCIKDLLKNFHDAGVGVGKADNNWTPMLKSFLLTCLLIMMQTVLCKHSGNSRRFSISGLI